MTRSVRFHPLATAELVEAQLWYEHRVRGLGDRLLESVRAATDRATRSPNAGAPLRAGESGKLLGRALSTPGFPYLVVYRANESVIDVLAVHHQRRRPLSWADRI